MPHANVSIIVTSYNHGRFVDAAVRSALNQTMPAEVIVVDDGSTDASLEILRGFAGRIRLIEQANAGQAAAMNRGLDEASGDIILFLDSDDLLLPHAVESAAGALANPSCVKAHWRMYEIDEHGGRTGRFNPSTPLSGGDLREQILRDGPEAYEWPPTSGNAWRRSALEAMMPMPADAFRVCPDVYLAAVIPVEGTIAVVDEPLSCWRRHDRNQTWADRFELRLPRFRRQWDEACNALVARCAAIGMQCYPDRWRANAWCHRVGRAVEAICAVVPAGEAFCLIDQAEFGADERFFGRRCLPFPHRDGRYDGLPADDETAIRELDRAAGDGIRFVAVAWPAFWWRDQYPRFWKTVCATSRKLIENTDLIVLERAEQ